MEKAHKDNPHPAKPVKAPEPTSEEMYHALHALVVSAETNGGRDNPEVGAAREMIQRHKLYPAAPDPAAPI